MAIIFSITSCCNKIWLVWIACLRANIWKAFTFSWIKVIFKIFKTVYFYLNRFTYITCDSVSSSPIGALDLNEIIVYTNNVKSITFTYFYILNKRGGILIRKILIRTKLNILVRMIRTKKLFCFICIESTFSLHEKIFKINSCIFIF